MRVVRVLEDAERSIVGGFDELDQPIGSRRGNGVCHQSVGIVGLNYWGKLVCESACKIRIVRDQILEELKEEEEKRVDGVRIRECAWQV